MQPDWSQILKQHASHLPHLGDLHPEHHAHLHELVGDTVARELKALDEALEAALEFVPRMLRGTVKKVLG
nr:hypothetical protein [Oceanococcus sp. HetDA_MAG_MS8]